MFFSFLKSLHWPSNSAGASSHQNIKSFPVDNSHWLSKARGRNLKLLPARLVSKWRAGCDHWSILIAFPAIHKKLIETTVTGQQGHRSLIWWHFIKSGWDLMGCECFVFPPILAVSVHASRYWHLLPSTLQVRCSSCQTSPSLAGSRAGLGAAVPKAVCSPVSASTLKLQQHLHA